MIVCVLRHSRGSLLAMQGVPMGVIAGHLSHADTRMTEKHDGHFPPSYVADTIQVNFPVLDIGYDGAVVPVQDGECRSRLN